MTRKEILDAALKCVNGDRDEQYGKPEDSFKLIAKFWTSYLNVGISSKDVAAMLALMKIARIAGGQFKDDNWIDLAGYAACGGEVEATMNKSDPTTSSSMPIEIDKKTTD